MLGAFADPEFNTALGEVWRSHFEFLRSPLAVIHWRPMDGNEGHPAPHGSSLERWPSPIIWKYVRMLRSTPAPTNTEGQTPAFHAVCACDGPLGRL